MRLTDTHTERGGKWGDGSIDVLLFMSERMVNFAEDNGVDKLKGFGFFCGVEG